MAYYTINGGVPLRGDITVSGAKNVALKVVVAGLYASDPLVLRNMPRINDLQSMLDILESLGSEHSFVDHTLTIRTQQLMSNMISLELGTRCKTGTLAFGPLLNLTGEAIIPNPGGCRIGARPIDRYIEGLKSMGAEFAYEDGFYKAKVSGRLQGVRFRFIKNTHVGTETLILAAVCAKGKTILENAAAEPEIDDLIALLNLMGGKIRRTDSRVIEIDGVNELHGVEYDIMGDRLEAQTFACAALATNGDVRLHGINWMYLSDFLSEVELAGRHYDILQDGVRIYGTETLRPTQVTTSIHPGFMTDWQQPWCVLMTQAQGESTIHETIFENRFGYAQELIKMGATIEFYRPEVSNPEEVYNFNIDDDKPEYAHAIRIKGPSLLHGADVQISDLRAGATLVIASLCAQGESKIHGVENIERGYENFAERLKSLGASIEVISN